MSPIVRGQTSLSLGLPGSELAISSFNRAAALRHSHFSMMPGLSAAARISSTNSEGGRPMRNARRWCRPSGVPERCTTRAAQRPAPGAGPSNRSRDPAGRRAGVRRARLTDVIIPTNIEVSNGVRDRFGEFYAALFDRVLAKSPNAVVTEYAWNAGSCDPCPEPALAQHELMELGADVPASRGGRDSGSHCEVQR